jgi:RNA recognition motif-containing protein
MQGNKLYVGNLNYSVTNEELNQLFADYGEVRQVNVIEGKGFGFVEMASSEDAERAKEELNNMEFKGRMLRIDEARPPQNRREGGNRFGNGGRSGGRSGGDNRQRRDFRDNRGSRRF